MQSIAVIVALAFIVGVFLVRHDRGMVRQEKEFVATAHCRVVHDVFYNQEEERV